MQEKYLEILDLQPGATMAEIREAYAKLSKHFHPDNNKEDYAEERFIAVNEAYNYLIESGSKAKGTPEEGDKAIVAAPIDEYDKWRRQAKAYAKKRAKEVEKMQQEMIKSMLLAFHIFLGIMIIFNALLITDYFLPRNEAIKEIDVFKRVKEVAVNSNGDITSDYKFDQLVFEDCKIKFNQTQNLDFSSIKQLQVLSTPIFKNPIEANISYQNANNAYTNIGNVYEVFGYVFPLVLVLVLIYLFVIKKLNQKLTISLMIVVLFLFQLSVFIIRPV